MSKKDFIALADALRSVEQRHLNAEPSSLMANDPSVVLMAVKEAIADVCRTDNPRFMRDRWLTYIAGDCGPNGGEVKKRAA